MYYLRSDCDIYEPTDSDLIGTVKKFIDVKLYNDTYPELRAYAQEQLMQTTDQVRITLNNAAEDAKDHCDEGYITLAIHELALEQYSNHLKFRSNINQFCLSTYRDELTDIAQGA